MIVILPKGSFSGNNKIFFMEISGGFSRQCYDAIDVGKTPLLIYFF